MNGDLTDAQWALLEPLLPVPPSRGKGGRPRHRSRRELIDGIRWRFRESGRWDRIPERYGPHQTTYALFYAWRKDGTWERLVSALGSGPEARTIIPWAAPAGATAARATASPAGAVPVRTAPAWTVPAGASASDHRR